jgi:hypothetical protein
MLVEDDPLREQDYNETNEDESEDRSRFHEIDSIWYYVKECRADEHRRAEAGEYVLLDRVPAPQEREHAPDERDC